MLQVLSHNVSIEVPSIAAGPCTGPPCGLQQRLSCFEQMWSQGMSVPTTSCPADVPGPSVLFCPPLPTASPQQELLLLPPDQLQQLQALQQQVTAHLGPACSTPDGLVLRPEQLQELQQQTDGCHGGPGSTSEQLAQALRYLATLLKAHVPLKEAADKADALARDNSVLQARVEELTVQLAASQDAACQAENQAGLLRGQVEEQTSQLATVKQQLMALQENTADAMQAKHKEYEAELARLSNSKERQEAAAKRAVSELNALLAKHQRLMHEHEQVQGQLDVVLRAAKQKDIEICKLQEQLPMSQHGLAERSKRTQQIAANCAGPERQLDDRFSLVQQLQAEVQQLRSRNSNLHMELAAAGSKQQSLQRELDLLRLSSGTSNSPYERPRPPVHLRGSSSSSSSLDSTRAGCSSSSITGDLGRAPGSIGSDGYPWHQHAPYREASSVVRGASQPVLGQNASRQAQAATNAPAAAAGPTSMLLPPLGVRVPSMVLQHGFFPVAPAAGPAGTNPGSSMSLAAAELHALPAVAAAATLPWAGLPLRDGLAQLWTEQQLLQSQGGPVVKDVVTTGPGELYGKTGLQQVIRQLDCARRKRDKLRDFVHEAADAQLNLKGVYREVRGLIKSMLAEAAAPAASLPDQQQEPPRILGLVDLALRLQAALDAGSKGGAGAG